MKIFKLLIDSEDRHDANNINSTIVAIDENSLPFNRYDEDESTCFENWEIDSIDVRFESKEHEMISDYVVNNLGWFVVTERFKNLLIALDVKGVGFYPLRAICTNESSKSVVIYIVRLPFVDAFDMENSKYFILGKEDTERISVYKYAVKGAKLENHDLFKLSAHPSAKFVTKKLKDAMEKNGITGCDFSEIKVI